MPLFRRKHSDEEQDEVSASSYRYRLGVVGRRLDDERALSVVVLELNGNYIVRTQVGRDRSTKLVEFVSEDFDDGDVRLPKPGKPTSYEAILSSIGHRLDVRVAWNIAIIQTNSAYQIVGWEQGHAAGLLGYMPFEETIDNWSAQRLAGESG